MFKLFRRRGTPPPQECVIEEDTKHPGAVGAWVFHMYEIRKIGRKRSQRQVHGDSAGMANAPSATAH